MASNRSIKVASKEQSRAMVLEALSNTEGTARDIVAFNAGLAIYVGHHASSIDNGIKMAFEAIASGAARDKLESFCAFTRKFAA
jgi:anthranilate phosphoribosyltransferase